MCIKRHFLIIRATSMMMFLLLPIAYGCADSNKSVTISFVNFPDGTPIPTETVISTEFQSLGIVFEQLYADGPRVLTDLGGILISGGPTGFYSDIQANFVGCPPRHVTIDIIGSGLDITARLEAFDKKHNSLGTVAFTYTGSTGRSVPFSFNAPKGKKIHSILYNGGLNSAAASISKISYDCDNQIASNVR